MAKSKQPETKSNRSRRAIYVFGLTGLMALSSIYFTAFPTTSGIASNYVEQAFGVIQIIVIAYLTSSTIDNAELINKFGRGRHSTAIGSAFAPKRPEDDEFFEESHEPRHDRSDSDDPRDRQQTPRRDENDDRRVG